MSKVSPKNTKDEDIDLFENFMTLWNGKKIIGIFLVLAILLGYGYSQTINPIYNVSVTYFDNIHSSSAQYRCGPGSAKCLRFELINRFIFLLGNSWSANERKLLLSHSTSSPLEVSKYEAQIARVNEKLTKQIYSEAKSDMEFIHSKNIATSETYKNDEIVLTLLNSKRIIERISQGQSVLNFSPVSIAKSSPNVPRIVTFFALTGLMFGVIYVFLANFVRKVKSYNNKL